MCVGAFLRQKTAVFVVLLFVVFLIATQAVATTIYVPDDYSTIQAAVDAASPGDTIIVRDGTYAENVAVSTEHLTIRSQNGATQTTVEIGDKTGFVLQNNGVKVTGFRIQGDPTRALIGVHIDRVAGCEVSNCTIETNTGVRVDGSTSATISNNEIVSLYRQHCAQAVSSHHVFRSLLFERLTDACKQVRLGKCDHIHGKK